MIKSEDLCLTFRASYGLALVLAGLYSAMNPLIYPYWSYCYHPKRHLLIQTQCLTSPPSSPYGQTLSFLHNFMGSYSPRKPFASPQPPDNMLPAIKDYQLENSQNLWNTLVIQQMGMVSWLERFFFHLAQYTERLILVEQHSWNLI